MRACLSLPVSRRWHLSRFMGNAKVTTTLGVCAHLFNNDNHADATAALGTLAAPKPS